MRRLWGILLVALLAGAAPTAWAQDRRQNEPGKFDYYLLALSWSPSFCEQAGDRKSAQKTLEELLSKYPKSGAAASAKQRLAAFSRR